MQGGRFKGPNWSVLSPHWWLTSSVACKVCKILTLQTSWCVWSYFIWEANFKKAISRALLQMRGLHPPFFSLLSLLQWGHDLGKQMFHNHPNSPRRFFYFSTRRFGCCPALARTSEALLRSALSLTNKKRKKRKEKKMFHINTLGTYSMTVVVKTAGESRNKGDTSLSDT